MQNNFDTARKLINELEAKLNDTSAHTATARKALDEWMQSGDAGLHKKGASALKKVRKRADSFNKALAKLELNIVTSLDKSSDLLDKKGAKKPSKKAADKSDSKSTKSNSNKKAKKSTAQAGKTKTKPSAASKKGVADIADS